MGGARPVQVTGSVSLEDPRVRRLFDDETRRLVGLAELALSRGDELASRFYEGCLDVVRLMRDDVSRHPRPAPEVIRFLTRQHR